MMYNSDKPVENFRERLRSELSAKRELWRSNKGWQYHFEKKKTIRWKQTMQPIINHPASERYSLGSGINIEARPTKVVFSNASGDNRAIEYPFDLKRFWRVHAEMERATSKKLTMPILESLVLDWMKIADSMKQGVVDIIGEVSPDKPEEINKLINKLREHLGHF
ncbi:hypothetical protein OAK69_01195 [bacterium]|nr:hypothetical protein [bacterium]MDC0283102.1 hypothetical protein [bacterium]